jgi:hypothetical protein
MYSEKKMWMRAKTSAWYWRRRKRRTPSLGFFSSRALDVLGSARDLALDRGGGEGR